MPFDGARLDEVTRTLIEGRERIERGWCQGDFVRGEAVCMLGALGYRDGYPPSKAANSSYYRLAVTLMHHVPAWNDEPGRTKEEVLAVFDRAIAGG